MRFLASVAACLMGVVLLGAPAIGADIGATAAKRPAKVEARQRFDEPRPLDWGIAKPLSDDACVKGKYLDEIAERFNWVQKETWESSARIVAIRDPREIAFKVNGPDTMVDKVYCRARAEIVDASRRDPKPRIHMVAFIVEEDGGFAGVVPDVEWCVAGYDHFREHEPSCRVLNPH